MSLRFTLFISRAIIWVLHWAENEDSDWNLDWWDGAVSFNKNLDGLWTSTSNCTSKSGALEKIRFIISLFM
jgi:hypothetical protein